MCLWHANKPIIRSWNWNHLVSSVLGPGIASLQLCLLLGLFPALTKGLRLALTSAVITPALLSLKISLKNPVSHTPNPLYPLFLWCFLFSFTTSLTIGRVWNLELTKTTKYYVSQSIKCHMCDVKALRWEVMMLFWLLQQLVEHTGDL